MLSFFCCWYLVEKKTSERGKDFFASTPILFKSKIFLLGKGGGVCAERDVTQGGSREQT